MRKARETIEIMQAIGTLLFHEKPEFVISGQPKLEVLREPSTMVFHFRNKETFTPCGSSEWSLQREPSDRFFAPLVSNPAVAVIGKQLHHFVDIDEKKLRPFFKKKHIEVPPRSVPEYIRGFVVQCMKNYTVKSEGIPVFEQKHRPVAVLMLEPDFDLRPVLTLYFHYGERRFAIDKPYKKEVEVLEEGGEFRIGWFYRNEAWEREQVRLLTEGGLSLSRTRQFIVSGSEENKNRTRSLIEWINQHGELLKSFDLKQAS